MTTLVDTSALIAFYDRRSVDHEAVVAAFREIQAPLVVSPLVLAEFDFLISKYAGDRVALIAARQIASTMQIAALHTRDLVVATDLMEQYADLRLGLTDSSLIVVAERFRTNQILTLDRRHFTVVKPLSGEGSFSLLPEAL